MELELNLKVQLELNETGHGTFLNFWDSNHGKDITCRIKRGKLFERIYQEDSVKEVEISLSDFINKVLSRAH